MGDYAIIKNDDIVLYLFTPKFVYNIRFINITLYLVLIFILLILHVILNTFLDIVDPLPLHVYFRFFIHMTNR